VKVSCVAVDSKGEAACKHDNKVYAKVRILRQQGRLTIERVVVVEAVGPDSLGGITGARAAERRNEG
jgi:hypothetical protein